MKILNSIHYSDSRQEVKAVLQAKMKHLSMQSQEQQF